MLIPALLSLAAAAQQPATATHLEVRPEGAFWVTTTDPAGAAGSSGPSVLTATRWEDNHGGLAWIGAHVAVGDNGAAIIAGKELNNESATAYASGSSTPVFDVNHLGAERVRTALAARAPLAATLVHTLFAAGDYQATLNAYSSVGGGVPLWGYTFPAGGNVIAGEVLISENGQRVVAVAGSAHTAQNMIRVFNAAGVLMNSFDVPAPANLRQARLSADGGRLYLALYNGLAEMWDTTTGANLMSFPIGSTFDAHALAGDGMSFAYGNFGGLYVHRETSPGIWNQVAFMPVSAGGQYLGFVDLDFDGSHAAWQQQRYSPAYDHVEVGVLDVAANAVVWSDSHDAPGTAFQLVNTGVQISADGKQVVGCTWGDSLNATPELFGYDAAGTMTLSIDTPGSVYEADLDADGDVVAAGTKSVHANTFGNGGSIYCVEAYEPTLQLLGQPKLGGMVTLTTPPGATNARFAFCRQLGASGTPFGVMEVNLATLMHSVGPIAVPPGGLTMNLTLPPNPALAALAVHVQGARFAPGNNTLTNKVSIRLLP